MPALISNPLHSFKPASPHALVLASQSPRRAQMLTEAGYVFTIARSDFVDDPAPPQGHEPLMLAIELASKKARHAQLDTPAIVAHLGKLPVLVLAADTIVVDDNNQLLGQPQSAEEAEQMLRSLSGKEHRVVTGVSLWLPDNDQEEVFADVAHVQIGQLTDEQIASYLATNAWQGKAGGYNLAHVQELGWPVTVTGDDGTVMGLPMKRLMTRLTAWGVSL